jgi:adenylate kinase family enzyme
MNKVVILGASGTGKTTICRRLGEKLNLKILHLDSVYWKKDWDNISKSDFNIYMKRFLLENKNWVIDGNYSNNLHFDYRLEACDTIIYLDFGIQVSLHGIHERALKYKHTSRADMAEGCIEGIDQEFLQYVAFYRNKNMLLKAHIKKYENKKKVLIFKSREELNSWVNNL